MTFTAADLCQQYQAALLLAAKSSPGKEISKVYCTEDKYEVKLDLQDFPPETITVKAVDRFIIVSGNLEKKGEKLGIISHQFTRRYVLPPGVDPEQVACSLGSDGMLTLSAPRHLDKIPAKEVVIPIHKNGENNNGNDDEVSCTSDDALSAQKEKA